VAKAEVGLDEDAHGMAARFGVEDARGRPDAALELVADHPRAAAHAALGHGTGGGAFDGADGMVGLHVHAVDVVQVPVPGFGHHRQRPQLLVALRTPAARGVGDDGVAHDAYAVGVGDHHRALEQAGLFQPRGARHLPVAVQREPAAEALVARRLAVATRQDRRHARADGVALDERHVADLDARHVGDGVPAARRAEVEWDAEVPGARLGGRRGTREGEDEGQGQERGVPHAHLRAGA